MHSYHLKAIILAEAKMTIQVFHPYIACHLCKVPRLMAESKESRLMCAYQYSITLKTHGMYYIMYIVPTIESH